MAVFDVIEAYTLIELATTPPVLVYSGHGTRTFAGKTYMGAGTLLSTSAIDSESGIQGTSISLKLSRSNADLTAAALSAELTDVSVRISLAYTLRGSQPSVNVVKEGRISSTQFLPNEITLEIYTPITELTNLRGQAIYWTDDHQTTYVDEDDRCCRFVSGDAAKEIEFP